MPKDEIRAVAEWLIDGARSAPLPQQILAQLCDRLVACGIPLWRVAVFVNTLHPQIICRRFIWRPGAEVEISEGRFGLFDTPEFRENPSRMSMRPARRSAAGSPTRIARWILSAAGSLRSPRADASPAASQT